MRYHASMSAQMKHYDVIVGGGHAGCEAAAAAARYGAATLLVTHKLETIGEMSCNPAIGGVGKGHLVREIDALDGLMGRVADAAGIQFRLLNRRKGPAVHGPRTQADRKLYRSAMQAAIAATENLTVLAQPVDDVLIEDGRCVGIVTADGATIRAAAVVLTTGTFLDGIVHIGTQRIPAGRHGEAPAGASPCRPAGMRWVPICTMPSRNVPVVNTTAAARMVAPSAVTMPTQRPSSISTSSTGWANTVRFSVAAIAACMAER